MGDGGTVLAGALGRARPAVKSLDVGGPGIELLADRRVPQTGGTIDLLAVARSGVWVIGVKHDPGRVGRRDLGGLFRSDGRLFVNDRDATSLVTDAQWQLDLVRDALGSTHVPSRAALCFVDAEWSMLARPFDIRDVRICGPRGLAGQVRAAGPLPRGQIRTLAGRLAKAFPPLAG